MKHLSLVLLALFLTVSDGFSADLKLASLFQDHMVLQRKMTVPAWGTADAGKEITVRIGTQQATGKADDTGHWRVNLPAMEANATGQEMTVTAGDQNVKLSDVVIGDVWVCSGQSNMQFGLSTASTGKDEIPKSANPNLRLFLVKQNATLAPQTECTGQWALSDPVSSARFSAVAYYFGKEIAATENVPVGLIGTYWGGTVAEAWTDRQSLKDDPDIKATYGDRAQTMADDATNLNAAHAKWLADGGSAYKDAAKKWQADNMAARQKGLAPVPPLPPPTTPEPSYDGNQALPSSLYNGMIAPLQPFAIKGAIWYQGESSAGNKLYSKIFPAMITGWRRAWGQGDFPFLWVQLPNYTARVDDPNGPNLGWAAARAIQADGLKLPATGMAITIEAGDANNLHPPYKDIVGHRLALSAEHVAYGKEDIVYSGPLLDTLKVDGGKVSVTFKETGTGLKLAVPQVAPPKWTPPPTDKLVGFALAGSDKKFVWADASITAPNTVTVSSSTVPAPMYIRYAYGTSPEVNLYNSANLPACPFAAELPGAAPAK